MPCIAGEDAMTGPDEEELERQAEMEAWLTRNGCELAVDDPDDSIDWIDLLGEK